MVAADVTELSRALRRREWSSVELTDFYLQRIEQFEPSLQAHITICQEEARAAAKRADERSSRGLWDGRYTAFRSGSRT